MNARGFTAVMARRTEPPNSLDYFPTPPWATRALFPLLREIDDGFEDAARFCWEPACGEGHMAATLCEAFGPGGVQASDVFPYGYGEVIDFLGDEADRQGPVDWIITNPPYNVADAFVRLALTRATVGVAMLVRTTWIEGVTRYKTLLRDRPPSIVAPFVERVGMHRGRWEPKGKTATSYSWLLWPIGEVVEVPLLRWIPPGRKDELTQRDDARRFGAKAALPLLEGA